MKLKKYICIVIAMMVAFGVTYPVASEAAKKKTSTTATTEKSSSKGKTSDKGSKSKSGKSSDKGSSTKGKSSDKGSSKNSKNNDKNSTSKNNKSTKSDNSSKKSTKSDKSSKSNNNNKNSKNSKNDKNSKSSKSSTKNDKNGKNTSGSTKKSSTSSSSSKKSSSSSSSSKKSSSGWGSRKSYSSSSSSSSTKSSTPETVSNDSLTLLVNTALTKQVANDVNPGGLRVNQTKVNKSSRNLTVQLNENFTYLPVNRELISGFERTVKDVLPDSIAGYSVSFNVGSRPYSSYISTIDKLSEKNRQNQQFVTAANPYVHATKGMEGDIVALWHSHGRYYKPGAGWAWQRPFLFQTAEDIYTMSYVLPFLTPMLENAGAYVMLPRERDINRNEVIVDNDNLEGYEMFSQTTYKEENGDKKWVTGELDGFIYDLPDFRDTENPFESGTYRQVETVKNGKTSKAGWYADIPEDGEYAIYVSYKTLPNSTEDARYIVNYSGGSREFVVNQKMGGGTWIYLGTFPLKAGYSDTQPVVALSNQTSKGEKTVVTADAVKIGGGMGNIARSPKRKDVTWGEDEAVADVTAPQPPAEESDEDIDDDQKNNDQDSVDPGKESQVKKTGKTSGPAPRFTTSGLPRFLEGARYWLHWAGFPESVYSPQHGADDYKDDYSSRGRWVNYLAGGSRVLPNRQGLNIPVDISFALHTDAGKRNDDTFIGTLGIYYTNGGKSYADGTPRSNSRILTDMIMRQVVGDIRNQYEPQWNRRSMWDKSYAEAHTAEVPTTLLELLSHQNFADMRYGLDPTFRFTVSRSIYKAMGRFIAERKGRQFIAQPLPVEAFMVTQDKKGEYRLSWRPQDDPLEPTAKPSKYIIMERVEGDLGFHKVKETDKTSIILSVKDTKIHSVYIIAANEGGVSFPSEILSFREGNGKPILIINGFTRVSGPANFAQNGRAGFKADEDFGVPYKYDISFSGYQTEFSRGAGESFGKSGSNHVATIVGGNTFDYPAVHGAAFAANGRGFVSCSLMAVEEGMVKLSDYPTVDLILGKQRLTDIGGPSGKRKRLFPAFSAALQEKLAPYVSKGGNLIVSGQNIVSDLYSPSAPKGSADFAETTLGLTNSEGRYGNGKVKIQILDGMEGETMQYSNTLRQDHYIIEKADELQPVEDASYDTILTFSDSGKPAGLIIDRGKGVVAIMSIPFETILDETQAKRLMREILKEIE